MKTMLLVIILLCLPFYSFAQFGQGGFGGQFDRLPQGGFGPQFRFNQGGFGSQFQNLGVRDSKPFVPSGRFFRPIQKRFFITPSGRLILR
jgi:hypothetical protein